MSYLSRLHAEPDWLLNCAEDKQLPCHSSALTFLSPLLAKYVDTPPGGSGKIEIPFALEEETLTAETGEKFLQWVYEQKNGDLTTKQAYDLALISHHWGMPGLTSMLDIFLSQKMAASGLLRASTKPGLSLDLLAWVKLADTCGMVLLSPLLELLVIKQFHQLRADERLSELSSKCLTRILLGVYSAAAKGTQGVFCDTCQCLRWNKVGMNNVPHNCVYGCADCGELISANHPDFYKLHYTMRTLQPPKRSDLEAWTYRMRHSTPGGWIDLPRK